MKWWIRLLGLVILGIILYRIDLSAVWRNLQKTNLAWVAAALGLNLLAIVVKAVRWHLMLRMQRIDFSAGQSIQSYFAAIFVGLATPGRLGELSRAAYVRTQSNVSGSRALSSVVFDRLMDLYALLAVGLASIFYFNLASRVSVTFMIFAILVVISPLVLTNPRLGRWILQKLLAPLLGSKFRGEMKEGPDEFYDGMEDLLGPKMLIGVLLTIAAYAIFFMGANLLTLSLGLQMGYLETALMVGLANLLSLIPITIAGVGTRDAVFVFCFLAIGMREPEAIGFSMMVLAVFYLGTALVGAPFFFSARNTVKEPKN